MSTATLTRPSAVDDLRWQRRGLCREDPDRWFDHAQAAACIHDCLRHCKVLDRCREWAAAHPITAGVMAGLEWTSDQRSGEGSGPRPMKNQPAEEQCPACVAEAVVEGRCSECPNPAAVGVEGRPHLTCSPECAGRRSRRLMRVASRACRTTPSPAGTVPAADEGE